MAKCSKGKACGSTCIGKHLKCRAQLSPTIEKSLDGISSKAGNAGDIFLKAVAQGNANKGTPAKKSAEVLGDINKILKGEDAQEKSLVGMLQSALGMGALTRDEVGRDLGVLVREGQIAREDNVLFLDHLRQQRGEQDPEYLRVKANQEKLNRALQGLTGPAAHAAIDRAEAADYDKTLEKEKLDRVGEPSFNRWGESSGQESKRLGKGQFGSVMLSSTLEAVKRGEVTSEEPKIMEKVGKADLGPRLIAADIDGPGVQTKPGYEYRLGRMAMSVIPGEQIGYRQPTEEIGGVKVAEAFWKARAELHRLGVAHNDMHIENVFVDDKGKARFVDFGYAQDSPKAALAEAIGVFAQGGRQYPGAAGEGGDWQVRRWAATAGEKLKSTFNLGSQRDKEEFGEELQSPHRVMRNYRRVRDQLKAMGFNDNAIRSLEDHGIRSPLNTYEEGVWTQLNNEQAQQLINTLYEGV